MVFRFLLISDEVEGFKREFQINADDTFHSLHKQIIQSVGYEEGEMASFFMCDDDWRKKQEITLIEMDTDSDEDCFVMDSTTLEEFLEDEKQRLVYVFDPLMDRCFFMELREIMPGKRLDKPAVTQSAGDAPIQFMAIEEEVVVAPVVVTDDIDFLGGDEFDASELDADGYEDLDEDGEAIGDDGDSDGEDFDEEEMPTDEEF